MNDKILLIESAQADAQHIKWRLQRKGYNVNVATNGEIGLNIASAELPDLIILDVAFPDDDSFNICHQLRNGGLRAPILVLTSNSTISERVAVLEAGANDFVIKPIDIEELMTRMHTLQQRKLPMESPISQSNPYIVGAPVPPDKFYGRERMIKAILAAIKARNHIAIYGERRIGKTSLLHRLEKLLYEEIETTFIPVFIQMQMLSEDDFFGALIDEVLKSIPASIKSLLPALVRQAASQPYRVIHLLQDLEIVIQVWSKEATKPLQLVFLLDEGDRLNKFSPETQERLRGLLHKPLISQHIRLVWSGAKIDRTWHLDTSPWFNLFKDEFYLDSLELEDARRLISEPVTGVYHYDEKAVTKILELSKHKPYLIQRLCGSCIDYVQKHGLMRGRIILQDVEVIQADIETKDKLVDSLKMKARQVDYTTSPSRLNDKSAEQILREKTPNSRGNPSISHASSKQSWRLPSLDQIFEKEIKLEISEAEIRHQVKTIEETLSKFGVEVTVREINQGPLVTQFGLELGYKTRVSQIEELKNDLALALSASPIQIEPIPGRPYLGLEIPNSTPYLVTMHSLLESNRFSQTQGPLRLALGQDVIGRPVIADLTSMPHLLIAGAPGSGKSVCINAIIACLISTHTPETLRLLLIDPKGVKLTNYNLIAHLLAPVVTDLDKITGVLSWVSREIELRHKLFALQNVRNIVDYNTKMAKEGEEILADIVIIIDELIDLMRMAPDEIKRTTIHIVKEARLTGIHLIIATEHPSIIPEPIKVNIPVRIAFAVASQLDSRMILDSPGAERLLGKGDMLYMAAAKLQRLQGVFVSDRELKRLTDYWRGSVLK